jgi:hypothetical protein
MSSQDDTPAIPPPPGVTSNFDDPESRAWLPRNLMIAFITLMVVTIALRLLARFKIKQRLGADDCEFGHYHNNYVKAEH